MPIRLDHLGQLFRRIERKISLGFTLAHRMAGIAFLDKDRFDLFVEIHRSGGKNTGENEGGGEGAFHRITGFYQKAEADGKCGVDILPEAVLYTALSR